MHSLFRIRFYYFVFFYLAFISVRNALVTSGPDTFYIARFVNPITSVLEPLFTCFFFVVFILYPKMYRSFGVLYFLLYSMLSIIIISIIINSPLSFGNSIKFIIGYGSFLFAFPFFLAYSNNYKSMAKKIVFFFSSLISIQFLLNFLWLFKINPFKNEIRYWENSLDWAYGTFMGCVESAGISSLLIFFALYIFIFKPDMANKKRLQWYFFIIGGFQVMFADSKLSYLSIFFAIIVNFIVLLKVNWITKIRVIVSGLLSVIFLFWISMAYTEYKLPQYGGATRKMVITVTDAYKYVIFANPKVKLYDNITNKAHSTILQKLFGSGPGNLSSRFALNNPTPLSSKYLLPVYQQAQEITNSAIFNPYTLFNSILGDLGWLGVIIYYFLLLFLYINVARNFINDNYKDFSEKMLAFSYCCFSTYFMAHSFIDDFGYMGIQQAFIWVAGIALYKKNRKGEINNE